MSSSRPPLMATYLIIFIILTATTHFTQAITPDDEQVSQLHVIVEALIDSNGDEILLISTKPLNFPFPATYLIPLDNPSVMIMNTNSTSSFTLDYHIIPQKLSFSKLQNLPIVTNNSQSNYTINHILITNPNFYMNGDVVIHGIKSCLNHSMDNHIVTNGIKSSIDQSMDLLAKEDNICNRFVDDDSKRSLTISREQQNVVGALLSSTQYHNWARALCEIPPSKFPRNATFLVSPSDPNMIINHQSYSQKLTLWYHIIRKHLPFSVLQNLSVGSTIPTAYSYFGEPRWWKSILVTNNSISNFTLDHVLITHPDFYVDAWVVVHGINSTINFKRSNDDEFVISIVENWGWNRWILLVFTIFFAILWSLRIAAGI
ncbi:hypothetical protein MKW92_004705 [Papaver armeniacum]|nr:hypothetical protein MKW92_004705 [Papaver armeniacum]